MRDTQVLYAIHLGRLIRAKWFYHGKLKFQRCDTEQVLKQNNIKLYKYDDLVPPKLTKMKHIDPLVPEDIPLDENHPNYKSEPCHIFRDSDVLVEGLDQARILTKCEEITTLPSSLLKNKIELPDNVHELAKRRIMQSCVFDAHQEKLPKRKDPNRPAFVFPRDYGITYDRKIKLLLNNLIQLCDQHSKIEDRSITSDGFFKYPLRAFKKFIQYEVTAELVVRSDKTLKPIENVENEERIPIPDLYPIDCTVSLQPYRFYTEQDFYGFSDTKMRYVHTILLGLDKTTVHNIYEEEVTDSQISGRNLIKAFTVAGSQARALYGSKVKDLDKPIVTHVVQTDGMNFNFSVLQLNTLDVDNNENNKKNVYWTSPQLQLYETCQYLDGLPVLTGYNPEVLNTMITFYSNQ